MTDTRDELVKALRHSSEEHHMPPSIQSQMHLRAMNAMDSAAALLESDGKRIAELEADFAAVSKWHSESSKENDELQLSLTEARRERDEERERCATLTKALETIAGAAADKLQIIHAKNALENIGAVAIRAGNKEDSG